MTTYFLSYARADGPAATRFADDLIARGVKVWVDQYDIRPSEHWDQAVEAAVRGCDGVIVVLSPRSAASPNVADEVSVALDAGKRVIPILIETCALPLRMTRMQFIDAREDYDAALKRCAEALAEGGVAIEVPALAPAAPRLAPEVLAEAEQRLMTHLGPIAAVLVRRAATRASTRAELYADLAGSVADEADRKRFLGDVRPPDTRPVPAEAAATAPDPTAEDLAEITRALVRHIGPIAPQVVARERPSATSRLDLCRRLGLHIAAEKDRDLFLREVGAA